MNGECKNMAVIATDIILQTLSCFFAWTTIYCFITIINCHRSGEWNSRILAVTHAIFITALSYWCGFQTGPWPFDALGFSNTPFQTLILVISFGYFSFDFMWCVYMGTEGPIMLLHHLISILSMIYGLFTDHSGAEIIATIFGSELTNPFLQLRWFLRETRNYYTTLAYFNDLAFMGLFFYLRLGVGSCLMYSMLVAEKPTILIKGAGVGMYLVGVIWSLMILKFARYRFFGKRKK